MCLFTFSYYNAKSQSVQVQLGPVAVLINLACYVATPMLYIDAVIERGVLSLARKHQRQIYVLIQLVTSVRVDYTLVTACSDRASASASTELWRYISNLLLLLLLLLFIHVDKPNPQWGVYEEKIAFHRITYALTLSSSKPSRNPDPSRDSITHGPTFPIRIYRLLVHI